MAALLQPGSKR